MGESVPKGCSSLINEGYAHLYRDDFHHTVGNHLSGKCEANEKPKPLMQLSVILPVAVEK